MSLRIIPHINGAPRCIIRQWLSDVIAATWGKATHFIIIVLPLCPLSNEYYFIYFFLCLKLYFIAPFLAIYRSMTIRRQGDRPTMTTCLLLIIRTHFLHNCTYVAYSENLPSSNHTLSRINQRLTPYNQSPRARNYRKLPDSFSVSSALVVVAAWPLAGQTYLLTYPTASLHSTLGKSEGQVTRRGNTRHDGVEDN